MTTKFKVGDKVRCVVPKDILVLGETYEVTGVSDGWGVVVYADETGTSGWWNASRFELVQEEPATNFTVGQEVFLIANTSNHTKRLKSAVVLDAVPKHGMIRVSVGDVWCYVEEDRLFVKE